MRADRAVRHAQSLGDALVTVTGCDEFETSPLSRRQFAHGHLTEDDSL